MDSKEESLREAVRETVPTLSDEELHGMVSGERQKYTEFAREVAREELERRSRTRSSLLDTEAQDIDRLAGPISNSSSCYIEVWTQKNFEGEHLRIEGPVECSRLIFAELDFGDSISSLRVGPAAFVLAYAEAGFRGAMVSFGPGDEIPDLDQLSFDDVIDSLRLINSLKIFDESRREENQPKTTARPPNRSGKKRRGRKKRLDEQ